MKTTRTLHDNTTLTVVAENGEKKNKMKKVTEIQKETLVQILGNRIKFVNGGVNLTFGCTRADLNYTISSSEELNEEMHGKQNMMIHNMGIRIKVL